MIVIIVIMIMTTTTIIIIIIIYSLYLDVIKLNGKNKYKYINNLNFIK